ncbi:MAG TPA: hypothetical protein VFH06_02700 [Candidatus Saccharimonadales bacterium]|nr:hypothetical protein [Candidatus Saccharimonadales bacterium]
MNKDVIYIDVEDDITAIIGKVKDAKEKIVALVPPKRVGVLQSAVNLRLLSRAAEQADKRLVVITNNSALTALAAAAKIPIAKNLQSKPEVPEITALDVDNEEDVIDGASLPIGDHARTAGGALGSAAVNEAIRENAAEDSPRAAPPTPGSTPAKPRVKSGIRVPNFNSFRKKLIFGIGGGVLLVAFLIWAIFIAPRATVIITARTTDSSANAKVALDPAVTTSFTANSLKTTVQQQKKDASVEFEATGSKETGEKAKGQMTLNRTSVSSNPISVPAGTSFSYGNYTFVSTQSATLNGTTIGPGGIVQDSATVGVVATAIGDDYNLSARTYQSSVSGLSAQGSDMSGGSKRQIKVVSNDDVQKAADQIAQQSSDDIKKQLMKQFDDTFVVLDQSFKTDRANPQATPAVDQEVTAGTKPKLTVSVTYSLSGVTKADVSKYLDDYFKKQLEGTSDQRVYDNGSSKATFNDLNANGAGFTANLVATAKIGPKIDDNAIKESAKGKRYGDIQSSIESIQGVDNVDVKFFPFWVNAAPNDTNRISIEFNLNGAK